MNDIKMYFSENNSKNIIILDEVSSTNDYAKELAKQGEPSGTVIIASSQTKGKGRLGRSFFSPKGTSIYMSVILRPDVNIDKITLLTPCTAVAAARAIDKICNTDVKIKWVNDLYLHGKKICGILTESALNSRGKLEYAVVGIGLNVRSVKGLFPEELISIATSIEDETGKIFSLEYIASQIIKELDLLLPDFNNGNFINEYRKRMCIIGSKAAVFKSGAELVVKVMGISDDAGLIVEYADGSRGVVTSGEARIISQSF